MGAPMMMLTISRMMTYLLALTMCLLQGCDGSGVSVQVMTPVSSRRLASHPHLHLPRQCDSHPPTHLSQ